MKRKTSMVETLGSPRHIVEEVLPKPQMITVCPLCKTRFKKGNRAIVVDLVKYIRIGPQADKDADLTIRIHVCEQCAEPVIQRKEKAMKELILWLAKMTVEKLAEECRQKGPMSAPKPGSGHHWDK